MKLKLLLIIVLAVFLSVVLVTNYKNLTSKSVALNSCLAQLSNQKPVKTNCPKPSVKELIMEKPVTGGRFAAYKLSSDSRYDLYYGAFSVVLEAGEYQPKIFSTKTPAYTEDGLFDIVNNELWVVNSQMSKIDIYTFQTEKKESDVTNSSSITYKRSISLPRYKLGQLYHLSCSAGVCDVFTAYHLESGCQMKLNTKTEIFSNITCGSMGGSFTPEPL